ncbi:NAD(P)/FAD-dependent oxidoreductase [Nitratireductor basaltis]|uniref:FAD dependent oxidoreductase n=1 Tax=Nitratireductor basaltis TaxID=472175 RepID=A0A084U701_9HYPH|nr:FAD-binding oxidoreductase [Nitratireductor basaltis]KFB08737.1 FAD dependent oxidoreductase [Nitratireductor basaltis]
MVEDIVVLGGGIIGVNVAAHLAEAGQRVLVIDRSGICEETSSGNAGALAFADVLPLSQKGMLRQVPGWLLDPLGPFAIPPGYAARIAPWLVRFLIASRPKHYDSALAAQAALMKLSAKSWPDLLKRAGSMDMLREEGSLELYTDEAAFKASLPGWKAREQCGISFSHVEGAELEALQPGLAAFIKRGTYVPGWYTVADPRLIGQRVWAHAEAHGARFLPGEITSIGSAESGKRIVFSDGRSLICRRLVIAAGAYSRKFAKRFGDLVPLETERGYNTTLPLDAFPVRKQLIFGAHGFIVSPLATGIRVGGAVELGGLRRPPNFARASAMLDKAQRFLPGLKREGGRQWMGYRPSLPDSLPVIGRSRRDRDVILAFGHGHLGLTQGAATGRIVRSLMLDEAPPLDLTPFSPQRF